MRDLALKGQGHTRIVGGDDDSCRIPACHLQGERRAGEDRRRSLSHLLASDGCHDSKRACLDSLGCDDQDSVRAEMTRGGAQDRPAVLGRNGDDHPGGAGEGLLQLSRYADRGRQEVTGKVAPVLARGRNLPRLVGIARPE